MTDATAEEASRYRFTRGLRFPVLAGAAASRAAWGVELIWGNVVRLVDPRGRIVADDLATAARILDARAAG